MKLKCKFKENKFSFVSNDKVMREFLWRDDRNFNNEGTHIFAGNLVDYLNNSTLSKNI